MTDRARTIFLGSGRFALPVADALRDQARVDLAAIVTAPPRSGSRGKLTETPVASWARDNGLPSFEPARLRDAQAVEQLAALEPELVVLADYGQIVPPAILELPRHGALNLHPSLLPRHRGASPIPAAILAGDDQTGVTLMLMDAGVDSGPIVAQKSLALRGTETSSDLEDTLARVAGELLGESIGPWLSGELAAIPQPTQGVTYTRPLRREDGRLDPEIPAVRLERHVRAYQPWPGTFFETTDGRVIVWQARVLEDRAAEPGVIGTVGDRVPVIGTGEGSLELVEVQPAGGRRMSGAELLRGRPRLSGSSIVGPPPADATA